MAVCRIIVTYCVPVNFAFLGAQIAPPFSTTPNFSPSLFHHKVFWKPVHKIVKSNWESPWEGESLRVCGELRFEDRGPDSRSSVLSAMSTYSSQELNLAQLPRPKSNKDKSHLLYPLLEAIKQLHL